MNALERLLTVGQDGNIESKPTIGKDILVVPVDRIQSTQRSKPDKTILAAIQSPLTRARTNNLKIFTKLQADPESGNQILDELCLAVKIQINDALGVGAEGICYIIDGAYPDASTPMQYGGFILERDREILKDASRAKFNLVLIAGKAEPYIDFVSDLPAQAFAWDSTSGWTTEQVRALRKGILATDHLDAEIYFPQNELEAILAHQEAPAKP